LYCRLIEEKLPFCIPYGKNFGSKKVWQKDCCKGLVNRLLERFGRKKLWRMSTCIANHWLTIKQSQMKQFQTSMNIIKRTPYFPGFVLCHVLVACCLVMVRCTVESMICGYHEYISKLSLESELDLLNTAILISLPWSKHGTN